MSDTHEIDQGEVADDGADQARVEAEARTMGWKPKNQFRGDPADWTDAETFIRTGEDILPILRKNNREMRARLATTDEEVVRLKNTVTEQANAVKSAMDLAKRADERGYRRGLNELKARQREAAESGDITTFDQTAEQIAAMENERARVEAAPAPAPAASARPVTDPAYEKFWAENRWFHTDPELREEMIDAHNAVMRRSGALPLPEQLEIAKARVMKAFPDKFGQGDGDGGADDDGDDDTPRPRRTAATVARPSGAGLGSRTPAKSGFDALADPQERAQARAAYASMKRQDPNFTEAEYFAIYNDPHGDVLDTLAKRKK